MPGRFHEMVAQRRTVAGFETRGHGVYEGGRHVPAGDDERLPADG